jgi:PEGA domain-containing protein/tetratricopeptide repeat protein
VHFRSSLVKLRGFVFVTLLALGHASSARADPDPRGEARAHYERGLVLVENRSYDSALLEFERAYEKSPHFAVLYNIGLCQLALGRPLEAVFALSRYLSEGGAAVPENRRTQIESQIADIESRFAELSITADRSGTRITVDGREIGKTPLDKPVRVPAGVHEVSATLDGVPDVTRRVDLREAERRSIDFAFAPMPAGVPAEALAVSSTSNAPMDPWPPPLLGLDYPEKRERPSTNGPWRTVGFVLAGAGVAAGIGGVAHYAWNRGRHDDWEAEQTSLEQQPPPADYHDRAIANNELAESIDGASAVTVGLFVASGALLAGGVTLVVVDPGRGASVAWSGRW